jgi:uncharacterized protein YprB with RNaseH-like and TPR domain
MELAGKNIVVLDLKTLHSADDCLYCGQPFNFVGPCMKLAHQKIGWDNHKALGLSVGCYFSYETETSTFFTQEDLDEHIEWLLMFEPLLVSFNGIAFDFPLMAAVLGEEIPEFTQLYLNSYDILAKIWKVAPTDKFKLGLNSLAALAKANNLPLKEMDGATAPRLWAEGKYEEVKDYNFNDVLRTRLLFEMICNGQPLIRGDGSSVILPVPAL